MAKDVRLAIQQLEAGGGARRIAKPPAVPPPIPRTTKERTDPSAPTLELDSDVLVLQRTPEPQIDKSIRIPKRRSLLPWVVLVVVAGLGGRQWGETAWEVARTRWAEASEIAQARWAGVRSGLTARAMGASQDPAPVASASSNHEVAAPAAQADAATGPPVSGSDEKPGATTTEDGGDATTEDGGYATTEDGGEGGDATTDAASDVEVDAPLMGSSTDSDGSADAAPSGAADGG
jgi:hypothetical protein